MIWGTAASPLSQAEVEIREMPSLEHYDNLNELTGSNDVPSKAAHK